MSKEFELKYAATQAQLNALEARFPHLAPIEMETTYYDNAEGAFHSRYWTFRRRMEGSRSVCTLKTPAEGFGRNEWEAECGDIAAAPELLCNLGAPLELMVLTARGVQPSCGAKFTRLCGLVEIPGAVVELALDRGVLTGGGKELPFAEAEVELKSGSEEAVLRFAEKLAGEFGLKKEPRSKVARARALTQK